MNLFRKKEKKHKWEPLSCHMEDILAIMRESIEIDAPLVEFTFQYKGILHIIGITSDYNKRGFFDIEYYLNNQTFNTFDELLAHATLTLQSLFNSNDVITVLEEKYMGDPRNYKRFDKSNA